VAWLVDSPGAIPPSHPKLGIDHPHTQGFN